MKNLFLTLMFALVTLVTFSQVNYTQNGVISTVNVGDTIDVYKGDTLVINFTHQWKIMVPEQLGILDLTIDTITVSNIYEIKFNTENGAQLNNTIYINAIGGYLGINDIEKEDVQLNVYPNPVVDFVTVSFTTENSEMPINVYSLNGQLVETNTDARYVGSNEVKIDMNAFVPGFYIVKVGASTFKVMKK